MKDRIELPDGRTIVKRPRGRGHSYATLGGERVPSVTTILGVVNKPGLPNWAARTAAEEAIRLVKVAVKRGEELTVPTLNSIGEEAKKAHTKLRDDAASIGVAIHTVVEGKLAGKNLAPTREVPKFVTSNVNDFFETSLMEFDVLAREVVVAHPLPFAGTVDAVLNVNGKKVVIDWKTSSGIYPEMAMQVAAYAQAYKYSYNTHIDEAWVIRFPKTDSPVELVNVDLERAWMGFKAATTLYDVVNRETLLWESI